MGVCFFDNKNERVNNIPAMAANEERITMLWLVNQTEFGHKYLNVYPLRDIWVKAIRSR
jgi:hypothetical protein